MTTKLIEANNARLNKVLDRPALLSGGLTTLRNFIECNKDSLKLLETDGMIDYNRHTFNRKNYKEQKVYMDNLKAKRYYWINDVKVPKLVYDYAALLSGYLKGE